MQLIIVAIEELAPLGRLLAHAVSVQKTHSAAFWTVKHYKDNELTVVGKQPVVFLGDNEVSKSYADVFPERFSDFGAKCSFEGPRAVLIADEPDEVSPEDIASLKRAVKDNQDELRRRAAASSAASATLADEDMSSYAVAAIHWPAVGVIAYVVYRFMSARKRKREYRKLQYEYAVSRFLKDEFEAYVRGVEGLE
jgi:hypothetical protein